MRLGIAEAAELLGVDEDTVRDWVEERELPAQLVRGLLRIHRSELLEWATERGIAVAPRLFGDAEVSLGGALRLGGFHEAHPGANLDQVLAEVVSRIPEDTELDREALLALLVARNELGVTAVGDGIAIPHVRSPIVHSGSEAAVSLVHLRAPLAMTAPDGRAVDTLFFVVSPTVHAHLALLARLAHALRTPAFRESVRRRAPAAEILREAENAERGG